MEMTLDEMALAVELDGAEKTKNEKLRDTHGAAGEGWIGFDLDGTLATYDGWKGIDHIGEPVKPMVDLITKLHRNGRRVKILTARVAPRPLEDGTVQEQYITVPNGDGGATKQYARQYIQDWCHFNLGFVPEIVYAKDHLMLELYDDRVKQVEPNTGIVLEDEVFRLREKLARQDWRCVMIRMTRIFRIFCFAALACICGCANIMVRTDNTESPYACAPHPYYCTWQAMGCLAVPFTEPKGPEGGIAKAYATLFFPVFLIDLPFEIVLDTVFFPVDGIYALCKDKPKPSQGEDEKVQEVR